MPWVLQVDTNCISVLTDLFLLFLFAVPTENKDNGKSVFKNPFYCLFYCPLGILLR